MRNKMAARSFRNAIGVDQLEDLQKIFVQDLNEKEFVEKFKQVRGGNVDEEVLIQLFLKIDASSDGRVDWEDERQQEQGPHAQATARYGPLFTGTGVEVPASPILLGLRIWGIVCGSGTWLA